ncbi:YegS/Rv2252/BmrU family lipid kinase [soil metagenome]
MKARVICNPSSGGGDYSPNEVRDALDGFDLEWLTTEKAGDAREAAREWREGLLLVVGGDGTINEVVNGLGLAGFPQDVTLGLLPTGTGNDLAATLGIPEDHTGAVETLREMRVRTLDAARVDSAGIGERYFANVATGGIGAEISGVTDEDQKSRWGKLAYLRTSLETAREFDVQEFSLMLDGEERLVRAVNVAVANCRYAGGGWLAAPAANPEDGLLDIVVIEDAGISQVLDLAPAALARSDYLDKEGIFHARAREISVGSKPSGLQFTADGEVIGDEPASFSVLPGSLNIIVGRDYDPEPG